MTIQSGWFTAHMPYTQIYKDSVVNFWFYCLLRNQQLSYYIVEIIHTSGK